MPTVPFASPQSRAAADVSPTFLAMAAREFVDAARATPPKAKAPNEPVATDSE